ncbi:MAG: hypothetical protein LC744_03380 [Chloroflexi bacterium]|nr:hypothetical protein [Chloroflexota bacterium]
MRPPRSSRPSHESCARGQCASRRRRGRSTCAGPAPTDRAPSTSRPAPIRRDLPMRTIFNLLGPITSPAGVRRQLLGVADPRLVPLIAGALSRLETERAIVVHGDDGTDELSLAAPNRALVVEGASTREMVIDALEVGLQRGDAAALAGGDARVNAAITRSVLGGEPGPARDVVLLNAGAALLVAGRVPSVAEGVELAAEAIDSGRAAEVVRRAAGILA